MTNAGVEGMCELVNGKTRGVFEASQEIYFYPGSLGEEHHYWWDTESAEPTTMLALAVLLVLAISVTPTIVEIQGGLF